MPDTDGSPGAPDDPEMHALTAALTPREFEEMTSEIAQPLMAAAMRLTRRRTDAEDLVQETLFRAYRSLASFQRGTRFRAWMFRILQNAFINRGKREAMAPAAVDPSEIEIPARAQVVPDIADLRELDRLADEHFDESVKAAIDRLPEVYRVPLVLFALGDLSYQEIADALRIPIGTVMSRLHRARAQVREELAAYARSRRLSAEDLR
jgi:RNA polymerase sigma-70 factor, ECF subfamily